MLVFFPMCSQSTALPAAYRPRYHWGELFGLVMGLNVESNVESFLETLLTLASLGSRNGS